MKAMLSKIPPARDWLKTGFMIKLMSAAGCLAIGYMVIAASQTPNVSGVKTVAQAAAAVPGFTLTFPPRPIPPMPVETAQGLQRLGDLDGDVLIVQFSPRFCRGCETAATQLGRLAQRLGPQVPALVLSLDPASGLSAPAGAQAAVDRQTAYGQYVPAGRAPLTVVYDLRGGEIGRVRGAVDWGLPANRALIETILARKNLSE